MTMSINTNLFSMNAQANLQKAQNSLATSMQRLSSGLRIISAADDAAGLSISARMTGVWRDILQSGERLSPSLPIFQKKC